MDSKDVTAYVVGIGLITSVFLIPFGPLFIGVGMILGSMLGMRDAWSDILNPGEK